jgi:hypothetical protein
MRWMTSSAPTAKEKSLVGGLRHITSMTWEGGRPTCLAAGAVAIDRDWYATGRYQRPMTDGAPAVAVHSPADSMGLPVAGVAAGYRCHWHPPTFTDADSCPGAVV